MNKDLQRQNAALAKSNELMAELKTMTRRKERQEAVKGFCLLITIMALGSLIGWYIFVYPSVIEQYERLITNALPGGVNPQRITTADPRALLTFTNYMNTAHRQFSILLMREKKMLVSWADVKGSAGVETATCAPLEKHKDFVCEHYAPTVTLSENVNRMFTETRPSTLPTNQLIIVVREHLIGSRSVYVGGYAPYRRTDVYEWYITVFDPTTSIATPSLRVPENEAHGYSWHKPVSMLVELTHQ